MKSVPKEIINLPNLITLMRLLTAPLLFYLALTGQPDWFIGLFMLAELSDVLDGYLARKLNKITEFGSHLDSFSDFIIYSTIIIGAWLLWPDILKRDLIYFVIIVCCFVIPALVSLIKFRKFIGYHTWSVKLAVVCAVAGYVLLFYGLLDWPIRLATLFCLYAAIEEISITLLIHNQHVDVRSVWDALKRKKENRNY